MAKTSLSFNQTTDADGRVIWTSTFTAEGNSVVQLNRKEAGKVYIYANIEGMNPYPIYSGASMGNGGSNFLVEVNVMKGMVVKIDSYTEVTEGNVFTEDE